LFKKYLSIAAGIFLGGFVLGWKQVIARGAPLSLMAGCAAFLVLAPFLHLWAFLSWHDQQRFLVGCLLLLAWPSMVFLGRPSGAWRWLAAALLLLGSLSVVTAELLDWALLEASWFLLLAGLAWSLARSPDVERLSLVLSLSVGCALAAYSFLTLLGYAGWLVGAQAFSIRELFSGFDNIRFFAQWQAFLVPVLVLLPGLLRARRPGVARLLEAIAVLQCAFVIAHASRGLWLGLLLATVLLMLLGGVQGRAWARRMIFFVGCGALAYGVMFHALPLLWVQGAAQGAEIFRDYSSLSGREVLWAQAIGMIGEHPWLGVGPMGFAIPIGIYGAHPHNAFLQLAAEWGLPFALVVLTCVLLGLANGFRGVRMLNGEQSGVASGVAPGLLAGLVAAFVLAGFDGVIVMPVAQALLAIWAGWLICILRQKETQAPAPVAVQISFSDKFYRGLCLVLSGAALVVVFQELKAGPWAVAMRERAFILEERPSEFKPRFWRQGWIGHQMGRDSANAHLNSASRRF
jgi:putative inorganic carbon (hco3(-)) transporter